MQTGYLYHTDFSAMSYEWIFEKVGRQARLIIALIDGPWLQI